MDEETPKEDPRLPRRMTYDHAARMTPEVAQSDAGHSIVRYHFLYSLIALLPIAACFVLGFLLLWHGVAANTKSWTTSIFGLKNSISDFPAGVAFIIVGLILAWITRFKITVTDESKAEKNKAKISEINLSHRNSEIGIFLNEMDGLLRAAPKPGATEAEMKEWVNSIQQWSNKVESHFKTDGLLLAASKFNDLTRVVDASYPGINREIYKVYGNAQRLVKNLHEIAEQPKIYLQDGQVIKLTPKASRAAVAAAPASLHLPRDGQQQKAARQKPNIELLGIKRESIELDDFDTFHILSGSKATRALIASFYYDPASTQRPALWMRASIVIQDKTSGERAISSAGFWIGERRNHISFVAGAKQQLVLVVCMPDGTYLLENKIEINTHNTEGTNDGHKVSLGDKKVTVTLLWADDREAETFTFDIDNLSTFCPNKK